MRPRGIIATAAAILTWLMPRRRRRAAPAGRPPCPWCAPGRTVGCLPTRTHYDGTEYRCPRCGARHTRKDGDPDAFVFFPPDVLAALAEDGPPPLFE